MKKKIIGRWVALACALLLACAAFTGCDGGRADDGCVDVLCATFAEYDWVRNIVGDSDGVRVSLLIKNGQELHGYDPSPSEMIAIKNSDVVISVGGVSDEWLDKAIDSNSTRHVKLSEIEGMSLHCVSADSVAHEHSHGDGHEHGDIDEHLWLSPKNARVACEYIAELLYELDSENAERYRENTAEYTAKLGELDASLAALASGALDGKTLVFADRFPFVYMLEDYGIGYYAAFEGCDTESTWTVEMALALTAKLDETGAEAVFVTESSDGELARIAISGAKNKSVETVKLDSMQTVTLENAKSTDYITIMRGNIAAIGNAFEGK